MSSDKDLPSTLGSPRPGPPSQRYSYPPQSYPPPPSSHGPPPQYHPYYERGYPSPRHYESPRHLYREGYYRPPHHGGGGLPPPPPHLSAPPTAHHAPASHHQAPTAGHHAPPQAPHAGGPPPPTSHHAPPAHHSPHHRAYHYPPRDAPPSRGVFPSKSGAFVRYQPPRYEGPPGREGLRDGPYVHEMHDVREREGYDQREPPREEGREYSPRTKSYSPREGHGQSPRYPEGHVATYSPQVQGRPQGASPRVQAQYSPTHQEGASVQQQGRSAEARAQPQYSPGIQEGDQQVGGPGHGEVRKSDVSQGQGGQQDKDQDRNQEVKVIQIDDSKEEDSKEELNTEKEVSKDQNEGSNVKAEQAQVEGKPEPETKDGKPVENKEEGPVKNEAVTVKNEEVNVKFEEGPVKSPVNQSNVAISEQANPPTSKPTENTQHHPDLQIQVNNKHSPPNGPETTTTLEPPTKRPRSEPNVDDNTPKAGVFRHHHHHSFFPPSAPQPMTHPPPHSYHPPPKRFRHDESQYYPKDYYKSQGPQGNTLRPIRSPTHRRSFSLESECRQDKPHHDPQNVRDVRPASYSPNSLTSRRSFDFYRGNDEERTLCKSASWNELGSRSMSWEVPPALSAICSFGQLNSEFNPVTESQEDDMPSLPPNNFPMAPRPKDRDGRMEPREYYRSHPSCLPMPRDHRDRERERYYSRSPPRRGYDDRYYEDRYRKDRRYESREMEMIDRRDPYESGGRRYRRYEDVHRSPPPPSRDVYFGYNDTPGTLSSRSFDSRSLGDMDEPMSSLLYRPSFSWERGLEVPTNPEYENNVLVQLADQQKVMKALAMRNEIRTIGNPHSSIGLILLLAMPNDRHCLSETLCIIRNNVEVFTATAADINAPAPGRKRPIQVGQVGLRCVYCRMCTNDRVKRAMCFPSSTKRIYRAVIDMKLDHFPCCPYIPQGLKARLEELSASSSRSTGMTVQYFVKSAKELGMVEMEEGVYIDLKRVGKEGNEGFYPEQQQRALPPPEMMPPLRAPPPQEVPSKPPPNKVQFKASGRPAPADDPNIKRYHGKVLLSLEDDASFLSPLRCFLRRNVCAFTATAKDIAVRTPTTFSVRVGQVGVGCVHCLTVPPKQRSNRAVCFPFTVARIYQSVADIQRFHLGECKMMPPEVRAEFLQLQSESAKGSRGLATRTYWIDSARKIGLADGPGGMYFSRDPSLPPPPDEESLDILAQVATNANTNFKPLVTPEDKPTIADFLYVVMEQLQPCLFTDADRNKRRSKNLGSIGVECKHCAGKIDGRKFFWSSVSAAESNFVSVHSHMMDCKYISEDLKTELARLKALRREQTSRLRTGSQKAFFTRVWNRLHSSPEEKEADKKPAATSPKKKPDTPPTSSTPKPEDLPVSKSIEADVPFDSMVLPSGGSHDEIRALLESKSTLSSMPSVEETIKPEESSGNMEESHMGETSNKPDSDIKMGGSGDSAIAIKSSMSSVANDLSAVSVRSKEVEQDPNSTAV